LAIQIQQFGNPKTKVDQQSEASVQQTGRRLKEFADSISFPFTFDTVMMVIEEDFKEIELGETFIVNCMIHRWMPNRSFSFVKAFLDRVTKSCCFSGRTV